ncbi:RAD23 homolog A, nucleotide excision repair protein a isoform X2 [Denticeps clupeoides]|uniref:RAD23 homolog A, nucleotide excision repair protein a isoform X2 n=1 Tax=Denticeps clupeoides TaxID=299321 RepID=UPI0010A2B551|nr:gametogenetin-like isoform X2 [Denticeps clupeoides]
MKTPQQQTLHVHSRESRTVEEKMEVDKGVEILQYASDKKYHTHYEKDGTPPPPPPLPPPVVPTTPRQTATASLPRPTHAAIPIPPHEESPASADLSTHADGEDAAGPALVEAELTEVVPTPPVQETRPTSTHLPSMDTHKQGCPGD